MVPQTQTRTETYTVARPVWREVPRQFTEMVPEQQVRTETYTVCRPSGGKSNGR